MNSPGSLRIQNRLVHRRVVIYLVAWLFAAGCSQEVPIDLHPAKGKVTVNGKAAEGVYVQFHGVGPIGRLTPDGAKTEADGTYLVPLHSPGEYRVTAFWPKVTIVEGEEIEGDDRFGGVYRNVNNPVTKVTIHEGANNLSAINLTWR
jgi:hypothetical protein